MKNRFGKIISVAKQVRSYYAKTNISAYAAQAGYFFMLSFIPSIILLLTLIRFTDLPMEEVVQTVLHAFPKTVGGVVRTVIENVYSNSKGIIPFTVIVAVWSAGKGVLSVNFGLNAIYDNIETRNYIYLRIRASFYTLFFIASIVLTLLLSVFGNSIAEGINPELLAVKRVVRLILFLRYVFTVVFLTMLWTLVYRYLPNRKNMKATKWYFQLPGACFATAGWMAASYIFSVYLNVFRGFKNLYGSMTTLILAMLWLYFCMYIILLGGLLNSVIEKRRGGEGRAYKEVI